MSFKLLWEEVYMFRDRTNEVIFISAFKFVVEEIVRIRVLVS